MKYNNLFNVTQSESDKSPEANCSRQNNGVHSSTNSWNLNMTSHMARRASLIAQLVKNPPAKQETPVQFLAWEDPLEKG